MTNYLEDSFNLYIVFYQGKNFKKSFAVESFVSWRFDDTLKDNLHDVNERYPLHFSPRLMLKVFTAEKGETPNFDVIKFFEKNIINEYAVSSHLYFIDEEVFKEKISSFFNTQNLQYISVWGDWEEIIKISF